MKAKEGVINILNKVLTADLTAINQYFVHAKMCENWGFERLQHKVRERSIDEMKDADEAAHFSEHPSAPASVLPAPLLLADPIERAQRFRCDRIRMRDDDLRRCCMADGIGQAFLRDTEAGLLDAVVGTVRQGLDLGQ